MTLQESTPQQLSRHARAVWLGGHRDWVEDQGDLQQVRSLVRRHTPWLDGTDSYSMVQAWAGGTV